MSQSEDVHYEGAWTIAATGNAARRTWSQAAGRTSGRDGYKFGDGTRTLLGALRGKTDRGWKEAAGRSGGRDGYKLGDFTRVAVSNLFGDKHKGKGKGMGSMPTPEPLFQSTAELELAQPGAPASVLDGVWLGFFNAAYSVGRLALGAGELSVDAIEDSEPSVLIGLPALAALECAIRSAKSAKGGRLTSGDGKYVDATMLVAGSVVDRARGAEGAKETLALFDTMLELGRRVGDSRLSAAGLASLRARALAVSGTDTRAAEALDAAEDAEVNGLVALSQSVATRVSQMRLYKKAFGRVLQALGEEERHERDMVRMMSMMTGAGGAE